MSKRSLGARILIGFIFLTFVASVIFVSIRIILAPSIAPPDSDVRVKGDYILMLLQCILGVVAMMLPNFFIRRVGLDIPHGMLIVYAIFLYCAVYLGEVRAFYYLVPHWDTILHTFSGGALGALGFSVICLLNKSDSVPLNLSPGFVALFAFCFGVSLGVIWEIYEFGMDYFMHTNMQKFALETGEGLIGQAALTDTMKDLIVDSIGAVTISIIGYLSLKNQTGWLERMLVRKVPEK